MRPKNVKASLGEVMGGAEKKGKMSLKDLPDIIGHDKMMDMPRNAVGKYRLRKAIQQRFGDGYRNIPGVQGLFEEFDEDVKFEGTLNDIRKIKPKGKK